jgi:predicted  nucleic acid-binding Zn-ribbon protein
MPASTLAERLEDARRHVKQAQNALQRAFWRREVRRLREEIREARERDKP